MDFKAYGTFLFFPVCLKLNSLGFASLSRLNLLNVDASDCKYGFLCCLHLNQKFLLILPMQTETRGPVGILRVGLHKFL